MDLLTFYSIDERYEKKPDEMEEYTWTARIMGQGLPTKAGAYPLPYLYAGHGLLLICLLLSSLVSYPGFPLTEVPEEFQSLLLQGIGITFLINLASAVYSVGISEKKQEPTIFWCLKCFLFGGLALGELSEAVPTPVKPRNGRGAGF